MHDPDRYTDDDLEHLLETGTGDERSLAEEALRLREEVAAEHVRANRYFLDNARLVAALEPFAEIHEKQTWPYARGPERDYINAAAVLAETRGGSDE